MNRNTLTTAVIAGIAGVAGIANMASAVNLNPDGLGQVLLYPYYTVNAGQQTLLSVVNTTDVGKAVKVRFLEGYNSREVLDFNLFLSPFDVWTANVFSLSDGGAPGAGAGIFTTDNSCTAPAFTTTGATGLPTGVGYQAFLNYAYAGSNSDTGPTDTNRTREGHFEMISMADIVAGSDLSVDTTHVNSVPPGCSHAEADFEADDAFVAPSSGLFGAAAVVSVGEGTFYSYNADALDGFTAVELETGTGSLQPSLNSVNDAGGGTATSFVFNDGVLLTSIYPLATQAIDAVSSVFEASNIYNEYESNANGSVGTDWVVNFPTKRFYVDEGTFGMTTVIPPFEHLFGAVETGNDLGLSCVVIGITIFDREENTSTPTGCGFSPCPPGQPPSSICHETNVITFDGTGTASILGSTLTANILPIGTAGWASLGLTSASAIKPHVMRASTNGNVFSGLPITGFEAVNFVNGNLTSNGVSVLSNYSGLYRHRISRSCANAGGGCS
jgi:hypothetical protein